MRRASICVLILTFLALVAGTLAVPARSAGLVWTVTPSVVVNSAPVPSSLEVPLGRATIEQVAPGEVERANTPPDEPLSDGELLKQMEAEASEPDEIEAALLKSSSVRFTQVQGTVALGLGQPDLHWQPLWKLFWLAPEGDGVEIGALRYSAAVSGASTYTMSMDQNWTVDKRVWAIQLGLILALGGLAFLALRLIAARRYANRDHAPAAAR